MLVTLFVAFSFLLFLSVVIAAIWSFSFGRNRELNLEFSDLEVLRDREIRVPSEVLAPHVTLPKGYPSVHVIPTRPQSPAWPSPLLLRAKALHNGIELHQRGDRAWVATADGRTELSVVSSARADEIFAAAKNLKFQEGDRVDLDHCHHRAQQVAMALRKMKVSTGKIVAEGRMIVTNETWPAGTVRWSFHVAGAVIVRSRSGVELWVIDPQLFARAVPLEFWLGLLGSQPGSVITDTYLTSTRTVHPLFIQCRSPSAISGNDSPRLSGSPSL